MSYKLGDNVFLVTPEGLVTAAVVIVYWSQLGFPSIYGLELDSGQRVRAYEWEVVTESELSEFDESDRCIEAVL